MTDHRFWRLLAVAALLLVLGSGAPAWAGSKSLGFTGHPFGGSTVARSHFGTCCGLRHGLHGKRLFPKTGFVHHKPFFYSSFYGSSPYFDGYVFQRKSPFRFKSLFHNKRLVRSKKSASSKRLILGYDQGAAIFAGKHLGASGEPYEASAGAPSNPRQAGKSVAVGSNSEVELVVTHGSGGRGKQVVIE